MTADNGRRIGFVSTRLAGTDGVSLETRKWAEVLTGLGHDCFCLAGEVDWPAERSRLVPEAHFQHPQIQQLSGELFGSETRSPETTRRVQEIKVQLKSQLSQFLQEFDLDLLIVENALAIPMNVPLGLALTELIAESGVPTIGHHHDFAWERARFWPNGAADYVRAAFPPVLPALRHVVINTIAAEQLALRRGVGSTLIPNVMDFGSPPPQADDHAVDLRAALGVESDELLVLQPTRIVPRKRIERAIELTARLERPAALVISHTSGDEGTAYEAYLRDYARRLGVRVRLAAEIVGHDRGRGPDGRRLYALGDVYQQADLVTYPSAVEGFGNAFLEAVYQRRPIVVNRYDVFRSDIEPKGFRVIGFDGYLREEQVERVAALLEDAALQAEMGDHNYRVGERYYSYRTLRRLLRALLEF